MASSCWQLRALLVKSLLILRRNKIQTIAELLFPIFLMIILVLVRQAFPVEDVYFKDEELNDQNFFTNHSSYYVDISHINEPDPAYGWNISFPFAFKAMIAANPDYAVYFKSQVNDMADMEGFNTYDDMKIRGIFATCSAVENIRYIGLVGNMKDKIEAKFKQYVSASLYDQTLQAATMSDGNIEYIPYDTVDEMLEYAGDDKYARTTDNPRFCFVAHLDKKENNKYEMSLHYTDRMADGKIPDVPPESFENPLNEFQQGPDDEYFGT